MKKIATLVLGMGFICVVLAVVPDADGVEPTVTSVNNEQLEEMGADEYDVSSVRKPQRKIQLNRLGQVLLIPESTADVVGLYDPFDGTYLGDLIVNSPALLSTPINAIPGPDGNIYLSDQVSDAVFVYDTLGVYLYTYADASDGLNNIRGIDFRDGHLFVTSGDNYVREFSAPHTFVRDFITGFSSFDILFLDDGRSLVCDITTDIVSLYDTNGTFISQVIPADFPEQVQFDAVLPGEFLNATFTSDTIYDFELDGTIINTFYLNSGRGVYRLGNGNLLVTDGSGIHEMDSLTGAIIETQNTGSGRFIELYTAPTAQTYFWDFETGLQGWTHTNGLAWPAGWDVEASDENGATWQIPASGDSSMWVDSDAAGSTGPWIQDTALSPVVVPPAGMAWFVYGVGFNDYVYNDFLEVGLKYFDGASWYVVPLVTYPDDFGPAVESLDVSAYNTYDSVQIYFYYDDDDSWAYYAVFDNVGLFVPPDHDAGTMSINAPPSSVFPNTAIDPSATYKNFGGSMETFDVYFLIDSAGVNIYNETYNVTVDAGADTTVIFPSWTSGPGDGIIYDITAYTFLTGDEDPGNDTLTTQTVTTLVGAWTQCANMPTGECANATAYDPANDRVYSFGGTMTGGVGNYQNYTYQYDPIGNVWNTMANMPNACDWIDASYVNDKFYVIGGYNGTANNWNMIYDISGNVWATGAVITQPRHSHSQVAYNDSLIYVLGGRDASGTAHSTVFIYNTYTDAWTTGTSMPTTCHKGGAAIIEDTIYLVGGWNNAGTALANLYVGVVDPANCENITWSTGSALPYANAAAGVIQGERSGNWYIFMVGGFIGGSTATADAWEYVVASDLWNQLPDYPPFTIVRNNFAVYRDGYNELYVCGGGMAGGFTGSNQTWKLPWQMGVVEEEGKPYGLVAFGFAPMANPTRNQALISYNITNPGMVSLKVYDRAGRLLETLVNNSQNTGTHTATWDARNVPNGVYFLRLEAEGQAANRKLILVR
jgi:hypothetical protein